MERRRANARGRRGSRPDRFIDLELDAALEDALAILSPPFTEVVELVDIDGLTYAEAAEALGIPIGTVMSRLHRARKKIRDATARTAGAAPAFGDDREVVMIRMYARRDDRGPLAGDPPGRGAGVPRGRPPRCTDSSTTRSTTRWSSTCCRATSMCARRLRLGARDATARSRSASAARRVDPPAASVDRLREYGASLMRES